MVERRCIGVPVSTVWTGPDAPRRQDAALVATSPDLPGWCAANDGESRSDLHGRTLTQALLGEPVDVLAEESGWARVVLPWQPSALDERGYVGWLPAAHLAQSLERTEAIAVVRARTATLDTPAAAIEVSCGTMLPLLGTDHDDLVVQLRAGSVGRLGRADAGVRKQPFERVGTPTAVTATAREFIGTSYLWGGTSGWGVDCSGLVHLAHRVHGRLVPRDADDQHAALPTRALADVRANDLLFFARPGQPVHHVGLATSAASEEQTMLHAAQTGELVIDAALAAGRRDTLIAAARCP